MRTRAESAAATAERILSAAWRRFATEPFDEVTLADVAADAGVTVQTVLRRFGSKEGLVGGLVESMVPMVEAQRGQAPVGDVVGAVANLVDHYEVLGDEVLHLLRQETRVAAFATAMSVGRQVHARWVDRVFEPWLSRRSGVPRTRLRAQLVAVCDVYTWFLLRRQAGLSRQATEQSIRELVEGVLP
jgi:AcrR family transcriptional regulator